MAVNQFDVGSNPTRGDLLKVVIVYELFTNRIVLILFLVITILCHFYFTEVFLFFLSLIYMELLSFTKIGMWISRVGFRIEFTPMIIPIHWKKDR